MKGKCKNEEIIQGKKYCHLTGHIASCKFNGYENCDDYEERED
jgi:hypothetical protein